MVTVGGSGVGGHLLAPGRRGVSRRRNVAFPSLRMIVVIGPCIDPDVFPQREGLEVRGFVPELYRHLAACDLAIVQGGLTDLLGVDRDTGGRSSTCRFSTI